MPERLLKGLLVAAALLAGAELALRLALPRERLLFSWERPGGALLLDGEGALAMRPGRSETVHDGPRPYTYTINAQGFREREAQPLAAPPGARRLLALGDSWVFGMNAEDGADIPSLVEALMADEGVDVVNAGVAGASAFDMLRRWRQTEAMELHGLVLGFPHNAPRQRAQREQRAAWLRTTPGRPATDLRLYLGLRLLLARALRPAVPDPGEVESSLADLTQIVREARARGLPVLVVLWPASWTQVRVGAPVEAVIEALGPLGAGFTGHALGERACWGFGDVSHPSEAGYRALAERVVEHLRGGPSITALPDTPRCAEVPGSGPGKPGHPPPDTDIAPLIPDDNPHRFPGDAPPENRPDEPPPGLPPGTPPPGTAR